MVLKRDQNRSRMLLRSLIAGFFVDHITNCFTYSSERDVGCQSVAVSDFRLILILLVVPGVNLDTSCTIRQGSLVRSR